MSCLLRFVLKLKKAINLKDIIEVIHEKDLKHLLGELGKYEDFKNEKILCKFCNNSISMSNVYSLIISPEEIGFVCDRDLCYKRYIIDNGES